MVLASAHKSYYACLPVPATAPKPLRLLVILPNWVGDAVMATPALRLLRSSLPGTFIGGLCRPGIDEILEGNDLLDEIHVERGSGVLGPKFVAAKVRPRRYDTALLFTNSFSSALVARIAGVPRRIGYNRDGRGFLLTDKITTPIRGDGAWAIIPACRYYYDAAECVLHEERPRYNALATAPIPLAFAPSLQMECKSSPRQTVAGDALLAHALRSGGYDPDAPYALLNPGGNNPAKRWPAERFAALADHLWTVHHLPSLVNGSPAERETVRAVVSACTTAKPIALPDVVSTTPATLSTLKVVIARARLVVTNDTGPRHIAAACGVPLVTMFGPTDHRWTIIPTRAPSEVLTADPTLPEYERADDNPQRCAIEKISIADVLSASDRALRPASQQHPS